MSAEAKSVLSYELNESPSKLELFRESASAMKPIQRMCFLWFSYAFQWSFIGFSGLLSNIGVTVSIDFACFSMALASFSHAFR